ncbi:LLM class flavin-dependent oxidoreductase [Actinoplanes oblitus]|uniref:LLM class flavin-dependent oxidoreductase n=1 Tax=Actinoplanes oblitus TaxID=3040509 RepID=A0ABY8W7A1_9ACTN|nr:LLM class flavin-dependent oxidoreductase [Actinoplanes oblitus]WIM93367.1 LLM class flavin-dependent oxidoreductase [Actinoplanes oblitus]
MRRGIGFTPMEVRRDVLLRAAALADELGFEVFSVAEGWGLDAAVLLAELAVRTRRITLVAGVLSVWSRSPGQLAMTAATLHRLSGGRFVLGLGASSPQLVEGWHDVRYARPAAKLREVTTRVRALLGGERATVSAVPAARPLRLGQRPVPELPIWLAASGPRTIAIAAELADGWFPLYLRRDRIRAFAPDRPVTVAAGPFAVVDPDVAVAREAVATCTATYLSAMGDIYPRLVASQGLADEVDTVRSTRTVPPALLDEFTAYGPAKEVRERLADWDALAGVTIVVLPPGLPWPLIEATIRAAAPDAGTPAACRTSGAGAGCRAGGADMC